MRKRPGLVDLRPKRRIERAHEARSVAASAEVRNGDDAFAALARKLDQDAILSHGDKGRERQT